MGSIHPTKLDDTGPLRVVVRTDGDDGGWKAVVVDSEDDLREGEDMLVVVEDRHHSELDANVVVEPLYRVHDGVVEWVDTLSMHHRQRDDAW